MLPSLESLDSSQESAPASSGGENGCDSRTCESCADDADALAVEQTQQEAWHLMQRDLGRRGGPVLWHRLAKRCLS